MRLATVIPLKGSATIVHRASWTLFTTHGLAPLTKAEISDRDDGFVPCLRSVDGDDPPGWPCPDEWRDATHEHHARTAMARDKDSGKYTGREGTHG